MGKEAGKFKEYYKKKKVTGTYDKQRQGTRYRRQKRKKELKIFLKLLDKKRKDKILELGCSSGFLTRYLGKVTAIDTSKEMLEIAKKKNPKARVLEADMFKLPFKKNSFDKIVTMRVWVHLPENELRKALREARRVLKKNGKIIFDAEDRSFLRKFVGFFYKRIFNIKGFKIYQYSLKRLKKILYEEDFKIEKVIYLRHRVGRQMMLRGRKIEEEK